MGGLAARIVGALLALPLTLFGAGLGWTLTGAATAPLVVNILVPVLAGYVVVAALSYVLVLLLRLTGNAFPPTTPFAVVAALVYVIVCTVLLVVVIVWVAANIVAGPVATIVGLVGLVVFFLPLFVLVVLAYAAAAFFAPAAPFNPAAGTGGVDRPGECFFRGILIGMNAGMNAILAYGIAALSLPTTSAAAASTASASTVALLLAVIAGIVLGAVTLLAALVSFTVPFGRGPITMGLQIFVERLVGAHSWLMPMSVFYSGYGWLLFYAGWLVHLIAMAVPPAPAGWRIVRVDIFTGNILTSGGIIESTMSRTINGFNDGCFSFVKARRARALSTTQHETGHHLHVASCGSFALWTAATDGNIRRTRGLPVTNAYGERIAESNVRPSRGRREVPVWD